MRVMDKVQIGDCRVDMHVRYQKARNLTKAASGPLQYPPYLPQIGARMG